MTAIFPRSPWIPEDDVLLKNAVEAGASLEALAKGAVLFSRRFSVRELRERWQYLLYDEAVSAEASFHMVQCELSSASSRSKGGESLEENSELTRKGKAASIRKQYYALRKKILSETFGSRDACGCDMEGCSQCLSICDGTPVGNCVFGNATSDGYGMHEREMALPFPHLQGDFTAPSINCSVNAIHSDKYDKDDDASNEITDEDLYGFSQDIFDIETHDQLKRDNSPSFVQYNDYKKFQFSPTQNLSKVDVPKIRPFYAFKSIGSDDGKFHSEFKENDHFNSPVSNDENNWETVGNFEGSVVPVNAKYVEEPSDVKMVFVNSNNDDNAGNLGREGVIDMGSMFQETHNGEHITNSMPNLKGDFVYLPDSLLNFDDEDETLFNEMVNAKDVPLSNNSFSPLALNEDDAFDDDIRDDVKPTVSSTQEMDFTIPESVSSTQKMDFTIPGSVCDRDTDVTQLSVPNCIQNGDQSPDDKLHSHQLFQSNMICTLNTECFEIPDNDDILFPVKVNPFLRKQIPGESKDTCTYYDRFDSDCEQGLKRKRDHDPQSFKPLKVAGSMALSEFGYQRLQIDSKGKFDLPAHTENHSGTGSKYMEAKATQNSITLGLDSINRYHKEPEGNGLSSDQEEIDSDDDIPYFSDVEAMILDMDLGPSDRNSYINEEVSKYQSENTKRKIIRLEQCAQAAMQRSIASQDAFAVLYGRRLKYFIRKTEVLLGRATDDNDVDIDLAKEGLANKISRQQAIIKLDQDGSFLLRNLGRNLIFVNGKEVSSSRLVVLISGCLIEVKGLNFVFEINHELVKRYATSIGT